MIDGIPLPLSKEPAEIPSDRYNCIPHEIEVVKESGEKVKMILKEVQTVSYMYENYPGDTIEDKAKNMKAFFSVIKEHFGEVVVDTDIFISEGEQGKPAIFILQNKIEGINLYDLTPDHPTYKEYFEKYAPKLQAKLEEALNDERVKDFTLTKDWVKTEAVRFSKNIIIDTEGRIRLIDVI